MYPLEDAHLHRGAQAQLLQALAHCIVIAYVHEHTRVFTSRALAQLHPELAYGISTTALRPALMKRIGTPTPSDPHS